MTETKKNTLPIYLSFYFIVLIVLLWIGWEPLTTIITPGGDLAADMLLGNRIRDEGGLLVGQYSRWTFNHPGPFWFYYNYAIEALLGWLNVSRYQLWMIGSIIINSGFVFFSSIAISTYLVGRRNILLSAAFVSILMGLVGGDLISIWMPNRHIGPYLAFIVCLLHLSIGNYRYLAPSVLFTSILIHGYAAMPIFTIPFLVGSLAIGVFNKKELVDLASVKKQLFYSFGLVILFTFPIVYDILFSVHSNISKLLAVQASFSTMAKPSWDEMRGFVDGLVFQRNSIKYLLGIPLIAVFMVITKIHDKLKARILGALLACLAIALAIIFYFKQTPVPIYPYVAQFYVGVPAILLTSVLSPFFATANRASLYGLKAGRMAFIRTILFVLIIFCILFPTKILGKPDEGGQIKYFSEFIVENKNLNSIVSIGYSEYDLWPFVAGLLLDLNKSQIDACTTRKNMAFLYTDKETCPGDSLPNYMVIKVAECQSNCLIESKDFGLINFPPILPGEIISHVSSKVIFINWSEAESAHRWSSGKSAKILFLLSSQKKANFKGEFFIRADSLGKQKLDVYLNDQKIYHRQLNSWDKALNIAFAPSLLKEGENSLRFDLPDAHQPGNGDTRVLALALKSFSLR